MHVSRWLFLRFLEKLKNENMNVPKGMVHLLDTPSSLSNAFLYKVRTYLNVELPIIYSITAAFKIA